MSNLFYIADLHFRHSSIIKFAPMRGNFATVEEHDEHIIERWNSVVGKRDVVYVLGDIHFGSRKHYPQTLGRLNGIIRLVAGNHDHGNIRHLVKYCEIMSGAVPHTIVTPEGLRYSCIMTHIPVHPAQFERWDFNLHGHTHHNTVTYPNGLIDYRYVPLSAEHLMCAPLSRDSLCEWLKIRKDSQAGSASLNGMYT